MHRSITERLGGVGDGVFGRLDADELALTTVILPTQRLGVWLLALLSERRRAFIPPIIETLEDFLRRTAPDSADDSRLVLADVEQELILDTLNHCLGNRTHAANILGISIRTLRNKLKQYSEQGAAVPPAPTGTE